MRSPPKRDVRTDRLALTCSLNCAMDFWARWSAALADRGEVADVGALECLESRAPRQHPC